MATSPSMLSIGSAVQDVFLSNSDAFKPVCINPEECFEQLPLGAKADVNTIEFSTGGGATNAAVTFARQGLQSLFMGTIGHDPAGEAVLADLDKEGVDTTHLSYSEEYNTGYSTLLLAPNGERTILTYRGASTHYDEKNFDLRELQHVDWLYVSSMAGSMNVLAAIFEQAKSMNVKIAFNPGKGELKESQKLKSLLEDVEVLLLNKEELQAIVEGRGLEELVRHAHHYCPVVIGSDGPNGVVATDGKEIVTAGMYEDVPVVDRTGAGDAFGSGFVSQWAQKEDLKHAVIFASANSTSVVSYIGAKTGILHLGTELHDMPIESKPF